MADPEDEDNFPNDFDGLDFDCIPGLQALATAPEVVIPSEPALDQSFASSPVASPGPSSGSNSGEYMDPSFLAAVDALEARALGEIPLASESSPCAESDDRLADAKSTSPLKTIDEPLDSDNTLKTKFGSSQGEGTGLSSANRKGKRKAETREDADIRAVLTGYETELTCPICCDLFVGAHVTNPCGHTCCGMCSYNWLAQNKHEPTCAVCRSTLSTRKPLLPNFSVDNFVQQHLRALAKSGYPEWQERGYKTIEWNKRLESWKGQAPLKTKEAARLRQRRTRYYAVEQYPYAGPWPIDESMEDDDDNAVVTRVIPRRGTRSRH